MDLSLVVDSLDECPDMRYVGFKTSKTRHFTNPVREKVGAPDPRIICMHSVASYLMAA